MSGRADAEGSEATPEVADTVKLKAPVDADIAADVAAPNRLVILPSLDHRGRLQRRHIILPLMSSSLGSSPDTGE